MGGAVREAVTNAAKHAGAAKVVVFAEVDDDGALFVSVHDDGCGFDPARRAGDGRAARARSVGSATACRRTPRSAGRAPRR